MSVPIRTALGFRFWRRRNYKGHEFLSLLLWCARRICGFREIKDRKEKVQWLIVPKDSPTVRQGVPICSPRIFFSTCFRSVQVGHSIRVQIHLHLYRAHTGQFSLPGCHLVTPRACRHHRRKTVRYVRKLFISVWSFKSFAKIKNRDHLLNLTCSHKITPTNWRKRSISNEK